MSGCAALAQNKYLFCHNSILKVLFFEILQDLKLIESVPVWYSPILKPLYKSEEVQAYWDIPVCTEHQERAKRVDAHIINHKTKQVISSEMSCPWNGNREKKSEEKTLKYGPLRWELKQFYPGY